MSKWFAQSAHNPVLLGLILVGTMPGYGQGIDKQDGHVGIFGKTVFAAWNFEAGREIPRKYALYPEILPNLEGWDFRINLPHVRFQRMRSGHGSVPTMVGVIEGTPADGTLAAYGHISNSIWIFQVFESDRIVHFKVLPSRRDLPSNTIENVISLESGWNPIGETAFLRERIGAAVVGTGRGTATVYLAARAENGILHFNRQVVAPQSGTSWPNAWTSLEAASASSAVLAPAFDSKLAMAWHDPKTKRIRVQVYTPSIDDWGPRLKTATSAVGRPQLVWDGQNLNLFYVDKKSQLLKHSVVRLDSLDTPRTVLPLVAVKDDHFDVISFNSRLHAAVRQDAGPGNSTRLFYSSSTSVSGAPSTWAIPSEVGFATQTKPELGYLNDNVFVIGLGVTSGKARFARKDPNALGNDLTGAAFADSWLDSGQSIDSLRGLTDIEALSFNSDIYLAGLRVPSDDVQVPDTHIMNFSRAAMKKILTQNRGIRLVWGSPGGGDAVLPKNLFATFTPGPGRHPFLPFDGEVPLVGDFTGDGKDDLVRFAQRAVANDGPAPVYVSIGKEKPSFGVPARWHKFFSLRGEIPLVGDFNADGKDDIVTFVQKRQNFSNGALLGTAPVWVALSDGTEFGGSRVWHRSFSLQGEIPMVGDFDGDGDDDIATFVQKPQDGIGAAPVWVALSDRTKFLNARVWHQAFSPKREIPMVGDFDGDGSDDIVTFELGQVSTVRVALSDGSSAFGPSQVWHDDFADEGQLPRVADLNLDGRDDIVTFVHGSSASERLARNVYVAFSNGQRFGRAATWYSDFAGPDQLPVMGSFSGNTLRDITNIPADGNRRIPGMAAFGRDGDVYVANALTKHPMPSGAPWEHYKWFPEKGLGTAMFPEWVWDGPNGCLGEDHVFALSGASGSGGQSQTILSVKTGGREGFVLQEVGHSIFDNCFTQSKDPFDLLSSIVGTQAVGGVGGINANALSQCSNDPNAVNFHDCRDPEHYFLSVMVKYRVEGEAFRTRISTATGPAKAELQNQYNWMKRNWFEGTEFKTGPEVDANFAEVGLQLLPHD